MKEEIQNLLEYEVGLTSDELDGIVDIAEKFAIDFADFVRVCQYDSSGKYLSKTTPELLEMYIDKLKNKQ